MKIICAPDKFKGSLTAAQAANAMALGVRRARPEAAVDLCPVADGGEGFVEAVTCGQRRSTAVGEVTGPLGDRVSANWSCLCDERGDAHTLVVAMAEASGLVLVPPEKRDPTRTTSFGTGELVSRALAVPTLRHVLMGIGGSATNDGGCGAAQALGVRFFDRLGRLIDQPISGGMLADIARIDLGARHPRLREVTFRVACDVTNPLTGPDGAAHVYGPQKGATPDQVRQLDEGLRHLARLMREQLGQDVEHMPGAGAAGGMGAGVVAFLGATLHRGIDLVLQAVRFEERVAGCALCLTGEGRIDGQTAAGKAIMGVTRAAQRHAVATIALVGSAGPGADQTLRHGLAEYQVIGPGLPVEESMRRAAELLERAAAQVGGRL